MKNFLWWRDGVIYQIYPRSFADTNGDGIGDLNGVTARLDYLAELGVDAIWLSPVNPSPDVDFGYDVSDYTAIDPKFGTLADFDRLLAEAHARGIRLILDLVLNHTSDQHPWFLQARQEPGNPYHDWYIWRDRPNNWQSVFGGSAWQRDPACGRYYLHMFYPQQPDLNWRNPQVRAAMLDVFRFWLERGVDGFRLDVFNLYFKDEALRDNPTRFGLRGFDRLEHRYDTDQPEMLPLLAEIRALLDAYPERYAVGETFLTEPEQMRALLPAFLSGERQPVSPRSAARYVGPRALHAAFDFDFLGSPWQPASFLRAMQNWQAALGPEGWPTWVLNNHDNPRAATRYARGSRRADDARLKLAAALLLTQRGTPYLYYGEEIGMRDLTLRRDQILDPIGRRYWPVYKGRDGCRAPLPWNGAPGAGFTAGAPWLPLHPDATARNVQAQRADPRSLWHFYRRLIALRKELPALRQGMFQLITFEPKSVLAYLRQTDEQTVLVALNFARRPQKLVLGGSLARSRWRRVLSSREEGELEIEKTSMIELGPEEAAIFCLQI